MEIIKITKDNYKSYLNFVKNLYLKNPLCRDSMTNLLKDILLGKSVICNSIQMESYIVVKDNQPIMGCVLAIVDRMSDILQMSFFEASDDSKEAFDMLYEKAEEMAKLNGCKQISAGLNIHVNYGLGFLSSHYDTKQSFGLAYNPPFYHTLFESKGFEPIEMVTYQSPMADFKIPISDRFKKRIRSRYTVRKADFKQIKREAQIYTQVNNNAFSDHLFYFERRLEEDLELFNDFKYFLNEENLLFVERDNKPVGFMLWYPDYHELMRNHESLGLETVIKNRVFRNAIKKFKIVEMGVVESEQKKGAIVALFDALHGYVKDKYETCESGWILKANKDSSQFGVKWSQGEYKSYKAYIKDLDYEVS